MASNTATAFIFFFVIFCTVPQGDGKYPCSEHQLIDHYGWDTVHDMYNTADIQWFNRSKEWVASGYGIWNGNEWRGCRNGKPDI
jgi:hypothetical protein